MRYVNKLALMTHRGFTFEKVGQGGERTKISRNGVPYLGTFVLPMPDAVDRIYGIDASKAPPPSLLVQLDAVGDSLIVCPDGAWGWISGFPPNARLCGEGFKDMPEALRAWELANDFPKLTKVGLAHEGSSSHLVNLAQLATDKPLGTLEEFQAKFLNRPEPCPLNDSITRYMEAGYRQEADRITPLNVSIPAGAKVEYVPAPEKNGRVDGVWVEAKVYIPLR